MKPLKVVFFGTPDFAKASLEAVHQSQHEVVGVVTVPDKASGRGQRLNESAVKTYAAANSLPVFQPHKLRDPEFLNQMKQLEADVFVVVAFRMMPKILFEMPMLGTFNLHASLLPDYRGAAPINYAIINGEEKTGATTFFINEKIDEGNILMQVETPIHPDENAGELHDRLMVLGAELVNKTLDGLALGTLEERPQPTGGSEKNAFKIFKEDLRINWHSAGREIHNFIRGMSPYPAAFTMLAIGLSVKSLKIFSGDYQKLPVTSHPAGTLMISKNEFKIATADGFYIPAEVQLEGKKRMPVKDFLNGFRNFEEINLA